MLVRVGVELTNLCANMRSANYTVPTRSQVKFHLSLGANTPLVLCVAFHSLIAKRPRYSNGLSAMYSHTARHKRA